MGPLPRTKKWVRVVSLISGGAGAGQVAIATMDAAEKSLRSAADDFGLIESLFLLMQLPMAARSDDFAGSLRAYGIEVSDDPGLLEIVGAVSDAIDGKMPNCRGRTDLGEMAQSVTAESLTRVLGERLAGLFGRGADEVRAEFARLATPKQFGTLARDFFTGFINKTLGYYLCKALPTQVGERCRFHTLARQGEFTAALVTHCREAAAIVETYAGDWFSKHNFESDGRISRDDVAGFTGHAMTKLTHELRGGGVALAP
jgi:hypothetical protein